MNLSRTIEMLKLAGIKAMPVPGTSKYNITLPSGKVATIKEKQLIQLANKADNNPQNLKKAIESAV
ncbi:hypothetical protein JOC37_001735 [Desulfohalotomaculum tongense]|uniref:hypothetical protein n=1 Tax=Desulforadius tongensis TaxID=1216062 RepID=UPI00195EA01F|nr:hypothetical protein [Desulforadius tongensis]MBM7855342.1 hypothetical protein [Desulforadius tongensis]